MRYKSVIGKRFSEHTFPWRNAPWSHFQRLIDYNLRLQAHFGLRRRMVQASKK
jgi:hypothetical protein